MVEIELTSIIRYVKAQVTQLTIPHHNADGYVDFMVVNQISKFAIIHEQDFSNKEVYGQSLKFLMSSVKHGTYVNIIVEGRTWINKDKKLTTRHYVIKVE